MLKRWMETKQIKKKDAKKALGKNGHHINTSAQKREKGNSFVNLMSSANTAVGWPKTSTVYYTIATLGIHKTLKHAIDLLF